MASTTFIDGATAILASWLNDVNNFVYNVGVTLTGNQSITNKAAVLLSGTGGLGFSTGAGGSVTQPTSKSTGVTINKSCGQITMSSALLGTNVTVSFTLTNSTIAATDVLVLNHTSGGTVGVYVINGQTANGSAVINVRNVSAGGLSEAIVIGFAVIKATTS